MEEEPLGTIRIGPLHKREPCLFVHLRSDVRAAVGQAEGDEVTAPGECRVEGGVATARQEALEEAQDEPAVMGGAKEGRGGEPGRAAEPGHGETGGTPSYRKRAEAMRPGALLSRP